jgi:hypothetical protein
MTFLTFFGLRKKMGYSAKRRSHSLKIASDVPWAYRQQA